MAICLWLLYRDGAPLKLLCCCVLPPRNLLCCCAATTPGAVTLCFTPPKLLCCRPFPPLIILCCCAATMAVLLCCNDSSCGVALFWLCRFVLAVLLCFGCSTETRCVAQVAVWCCSLLITRVPPSCTGVWLKWLCGAAAYSSRE